MQFYTGYWLFCQAEEKENTKNKMAYMNHIIRFGIKTADQTMGFGGIGRKAKVDMERARAEVGMLLDRQKRGNVM